MPIQERLQSWGWPALCHARFAVHGIVQGATDAREYAVGIAVQRRHEGGGRPVGFDVHAIAQGDTDAREYATGLAV